ncbi:hypothetical protein AAFF_G00223810 [Aldrovandia affinis]|uniref:Uncharacterized protein n=1 Tax=Aldrovandia affinis TaxID=143900 RepID=A0AAD7X2A1_9TELE|nr:hypothetical protein AAFF_G00223810 [Aldrovandia affinis]
MHSEYLGLSSTRPAEGSRQASERRNVKRKRGFEKDEDQELVHCKNLGLPSTRTRPAKCSRQGPEQSSDQAAEPAEIQPHTGKAKSDTRPIRFPEYGQCYALVSLKTADLQGSPGQDQQSALNKGPAQNKQLTHLEQLEHYEGHHKHEPPQPPPFCTEEETDGDG